MATTLSATIPPYCPPLPPSAESVEKTPLPQEKTPGMHRNTNTAKLISLCIAVAVIAITSVGIVFFQVYNPAVLVFCAAPISVLCSSLKLAKYLSIMLKDVTE